ncbi:energy transducer TonB [Paraburkholderia unamae]|uniref:Protein TonB n=1 Tax=Paraburkholderia unamae TaxID=219649 RepID=A0ABX5KKI4_9BURK|nr:energy transducer TonB [Paraburkholderia unamae]PVX81324.1 outer membrane transport energization protein TonB [Paraburkholderia unamae]
MTSDSLPARPWDGLAVRENVHQAPYARTRRVACAAGVLLAHALGLYVAVHQSAVTLKLEAGRPAGGSVQVQLVAAPTPQPARPTPTPPEPPKPQAEPPKPVARPKIEKTHVLASRAPSPRTVEAAPAETPKAAEAKPAAPPPAPVANAAPAQPAAPAQAAPGPNLLDAPRQISAGELKQLGCQMPRPDYPAKARRLEQEGTVLVHLSIGADGAVTSARVAQSSGSPLLDAAAVAAIRAGRCHPYETAGIARSVEATQPVAFNLND